MGTGSLGATGTVAFGIAIVLLAGCGPDGGSGSAIEEPPESEAVMRCEVLARGELPDDVDGDASLDDLLARERERCWELGVDLPAAGSSAGGGAAGDGTGSAGDGDGGQRSDGGAQDDGTIEDEGSADETSDTDDPSEDVDRTLIELARVYCDIRTETESYTTQPPQPVEERLEAASLELFAALEAIGSGLTDPAFQAEAHRICPEWVPDPTQ